MRFKNKIALVTGAASGIGLQIAREFAEEGATVIATDINDAVLGLESSGGGKIVGRVSDAGDVTAIKELAASVEGEFGVLDALVNNAGYAVIANPETVDEGEYARQMDVLLNGPVFMVKHLASLLRKSANGSVMNISSASADLTMPGYCPYGTAKEAIIKFTVDCTVTVPGIRHNAILPGFIETPILADAYGEEMIETIKGFIAQVCPIPRLGTTKDIADAVLFLASDNAAYINGARLSIDGGVSKVGAPTLLGLGASISIPEA